MYAKGTLTESHKPSEFAFSRPPAVLLYICVPYKHVRMRVSLCALLFIVCLNSFIIIFFFSALFFQFYFYFLFIFCYSSLSLCQHTIGYDIQIHVVTVNYRRRKEKKRLIAWLHVFKNKAVNVYHVYSSVYSSCICMWQFERRISLCHRVSHTYVCESGFYLIWAELRLFFKRETKKNKNKTWNKERA